MFSFSTALQKLDHFTREKQIFLKFSSSYYTDINYDRRQLRPAIGTDE